MSLGSEDLGTAVFDDMIGSGDGEAVYCELWRGVI